MATQPTQRVHLKRSVQQGCLVAFMLTLIGCQTIRPSALPPSMVETTALSVNELKAHPSKNAKPVVALVLGSGGARGYAHIGVIDVLERQGIRPDFIVGVSAGSIVGALYASGQTPEQLRQTALSLKAGHVRDLTFDLKGFFDGQKVEDYINEQVGYTALEQMKIPFYVVATELQNGHLRVFKTGNTGQAVRASSSIPSMFVPTEIHGKEYVDGGLVSPVPVEVARQLGADVVIAVNILAQPKYTETSNVWGLFNQNINIMQNGLAAREMIHADVVIQPDIREKGHIFSTKSREDTMRAGKEAAEAAMPQISTALAAHQPSSASFNIALQQPNEHDLKEDQRKDK